MYEVMFVGSNPSEKSASIVPFWRDAKSTKVLAKWLEMVNNDDVYRITQAHYVNVLDVTTPNNRPLKISEIKNGLPVLAYKIGDTGPDKIIALGKTAEKALTLLGVEFYAMPHPSGRNRLLNDPKYVEEKINGLRAYLSPFKIEY